jgi:uncharacterized protein (TIGR00297 family)
VLADVAHRALVGALVAAAIALVARRARALSPSGAIAAVGLGTVCAMAGAVWAFLLIAFFLASTALGRIRSDERARRTEGIVAKGGNRDAQQVLANGGVFAACALGFLVSGSPLWMAAGGGALASAAADTWATEIGSLARTPPRDILRRTPVAPGTSGGVTGTGTLASVGGALFVGGLVVILGWPPAAFGATVVGGVVGALTDSVLGSALQVRRWCDRCNSATERPVHLCGSPTRVAGGLHWMDNDTVNLSSVMLGGTTALILYAAFG